ncbi:hypothetical protein I546_0899 [Mycobacterium kansasii 732]|nr:hypothetical protein I546_0899 [Mycobacterium kansasii 732]
MLAVSGLPSWSFTTIERCIATLPPIEEVWARLPDAGATAQLKRRENLLDVATLSCPAIELLHLLISRLGIFHTIIRHPPSVKASTKQTLIAGGLDGSVLLVNKTMTVRLDNQHFLFTGAGDFTINRRLLHRVAAELGLAKRAVKDCRINPADYCPESELRLLKGIVSPFFSPAIARPTLRGVVLIAPTEVDRPKGTWLRYRCRHLRAWLCGSPTCLHWCGITRRAHIPTSRGPHLVLNSAGSGPSRITAHVRDCARRRWAAASLCKRRRSMQRRRQQPGR